VGAAKLLQAHLVQGSELDDFFERFDGALEQRKSVQPFCLERCGLRQQAPSGKAPSGKANTRQANTQQPRGADRT